MGDKFTVRDFFTYILSGCCVYLCFFIIEYYMIQEFVKEHKNFIKDYSTLLLFISLPILYFTGQILQSLDMLLYFIGKGIKKRIDNPEKSKQKIYLFLYKIISRHRITGNLMLKGIIDSEFWKKCNALELASKYSHAEYSYILNDLFKGVLILTSVCTVYTFVKEDYYLCIFFFINTFLSWLRAIHYANIFVDTVNSSHQILIENREI